MDQKINLQLFSTPLIVIKTDENDHKKLYDQYYQKVIDYKEKNSSRALNRDPHRKNYVSDTNGYTSFYRDSLLNNSSFYGLISYLNEKISKHLCEQENLDYLDLKWMDCWFNVYSKGQNVEEHFHPNSIISGVYYLKCPPNCGDIVFFDQLYGFKNYCKNMSFLKTFIYPQKFKLTPEDGMLVLFPSWLIHKTTPNLSEEDRIVFSFNLVPMPDNYELDNLGPLGYFKYFK